MVLKSVIMEVMCAPAVDTAYSTPRNTLYGQMRDRIGDEEAPDPVQDVDTASTRMEKPEESVQLRDSCRVVGVTDTEMVAGNTSGVADELLAPAGPVAWYCHVPFRMDGTACALHRTSARQCKARISTAQERARTVSVITATMCGAALLLHRTTLCVGVVNFTTDTL